MGRRFGASFTNAVGRSPKVGETARVKICLFALVVLLVSVSAPIATAEESATPSPDLPAAILENGDLGDELTNAEAAEELPHRDLDRSEATALIEGVFEPALESPAGVFADLEAKSFLSNYAAVVPSGQVSSEALVGEANSGPDSAYSLLESTIPLRVEGEAIDLTLGRSNGVLQPANPLVEVKIPDQLGEGVALPQSGVEIHFPDAVEDRSPNIVTDATAMYPNVAPDSDLVVAPSPTGVETFTTLRSADAPRTAALQLSLPAGAELVPWNGGAVVKKEDGEGLVKVLPPTAFDAAGNPVPVSLDVSGSTITVTASPNEDTQWPVLVDPIIESYNWAGYNQTGVGDWEGYSNNSPLMAWGYGYYPGNPGAGWTGLIVESTNTNFSPGVEVGFRHTVPRLAAEEKEGRTPTSYIAGMVMNPVAVKTSAGTSSPYALAAIFKTHYTNWAGLAPHQAVWGYSGNAAPFSYGVLTFSTGNDHEAKIAVGAALSVNEPAWSSSNRQMWIGAVGVEVSDEDAPKPKGDGTVTEWVNQVATTPLSSTAEDPGLGVKRMSFEIPGQGTKVATNPCAGTMANPCPLKWSGSVAASEYKPAEMPQGLDYVPIVSEDPLGHKSTDPEKALVRVDHTAPTIGTLSGTLTEQAKVGPKLPQYTLKYTASDGTEAAPQSGVVSTEVLVDGSPLEPKYAPGCATKNCSITKEWTLEARKFSAGKHTVKVLATDGVKLVGEAKALEIELQPDSNAPNLVVSGTMTEQASLGTNRPQYKLKLSASDGASNNPVAAYAFNEGSGTTANDAAGSHTGTVTSPSWVEGKFGKALSFNGTSSCVSVPNNVDLQLSGNFTLQAWINPANTTQEFAPIFFKEATEFYGYSLFFGAFEAGHIQGYIADKPWQYTEVESPEKLIANTWAHVAMTSDGTTLRLYMNGKQIDTASAKAAMESKGPLLIGCGKSLGAEFFKGLIDNVRIYPRTLSAAEIETDKGTAVAPTSGPIQSGIAKTEITLDGKVVDSSTGCSGENCTVAREWALSSAGSAGKHTVVTKVTDGFGNTTSKTTEIEIQPDTTKPTITTGGALVSAPMGWVEQQSYAFTASAKDAGYGVTSLALKIDGQQVASSGAACPEGGCEASLSKTVNVASYKGGEHPALLIATDGAGNVLEKAWDINVDPKGSVSVSEVADTLEAVEETVEGTEPVATTEEYLGAELMEAGDNPHFVKEGGEINSSGVTVDTSISLSSGAVEIDGPTSDIKITPSGGGTPGTTTVESGVAAVRPSLQQGVDTVIRPEFNGALFFTDIREPSSPEKFSWQVTLTSGKTLKQLDAQHAEIDFEGQEMALISAEPAHDATGKAVPTHIEVSGSVVTLVVEHHSGAFTYPVVAGQAYEVGYASVTFTLPPEDPPPPNPWTEPMAEEIVKGDFQEWTVNGPPIIGAGGQKTFPIYRSKCGKSCGRYKATVYNAAVEVGSWGARWENGTEVHAKLDISLGWELAGMFGETFNCGSVGPHVVKKGSDDHLMAYGHFNVTAIAGAGLAFGLPTVKPLKEVNFALQDWVYPNGLQVKYVLDWSGQPNDHVCPRVTV